MSNLHDQTKNLMSKLLVKDCKSLNLLRVHAFETGMEGVLRSEFMHLFVGLQISK
jgi:hypothetical protein